MSKQMTDEQRAVYGAHLRSIDPRTAYGRMWASFNACLDAHWVDLGDGKPWLDCSHMVCHWPKELQRDVAHRDALAYLASNES